MKKETIDFLKELKELIDNLPPVRNGFQRVFRGQHTNYGKIISAAHRPTHNKDLNFLWDNYCKKIAVRMSRHENSQETTENESEIFEFFETIKVLSQHYGPGTQYLDVTNSLEIALWFAFNEIKINPCKIVTGFGDKPNKYDILILCDFLTHKVINHSAWLFVFDFPIAQNILTKSHGEVINLGVLSSNIIETSKRISKQQAQLVYCDQAIDGGDLSSFLVCEPLSLALTVFEKHLALPTSSIFPGPNEDRWYKNFLKLPFFYDGYTSSGQDIARRTTPVELYANDFRR